MLRKIVRAGARHPSFQEAADALQDMAEVTISGRQVTRIAEESAANSKPAGIGRPDNSKTGSSAPR